MAPEDVPEPDVEVWPCNWDAVMLFISVSTQWRRDSGRATGLDYNALFARMARMDLDNAAHEDLFQKVRVIEVAALEKMREK